MTVTLNANSFKIPGITLSSANATIELNTGSAAVKETFDGNATLDLPAGPFVRVTITNLTLSIGGTPITGDFSFDQSTLADGTKLTRFAVANGSLTTSDGNGITNATGAFVISSDGVTGVISGTVGVAAGGFQAGGTIGVRLNTGTSPVDQTITLGGKTIHVLFGDTEVKDSSGKAFFQVFGSGLTLNIGDFVSIEGNVAFSSDGSFAATGVTIFLGQGPAKLGNGDINPLAVGVLLTDARIGLIKVTTGGVDTYALDAVGTVSLIGLSGVTITGTAHVRVNTTGMPIDRMLLIPGSSDPGVLVEFDTADKVTQFQALNTTLSLLGQTLTGNFAVDQATDARGARDIRIAASGVSLTLGDAPISVSNGQGSLIVAGSGVAGQFSADVTTSIPNVTFNGNFGLAINTTGTAVNQVLTAGNQSIALDLPAGPYLKVSATGLNLSILGQTLTGDFAIEPRHAARHHRGHADHRLEREREPARHGERGER